MRPLVHWLRARHQFDNQISVSFPNNPELERMFREHRER
jgi:hypothetical protein